MYVSAIIIMIASFAVVAGGFFAAVLRLLSHNDKN